MMVFVPKIQLETILLGLALLVLLQQTCVVINAH
jgi:hypothetical protein